MNIAERFTLQKAIAVLPAYERAVVRLVAGEGMFVDEALKVHSNTAARRYARVVLKPHAFLVDRGWVRPLLVDEGGSATRRRAHPSRR